MVKGKEMLDLELVQRYIDYRFENADLLKQAFTTRSYSNENGGANNQVLEFIGDKALDLVIIRKMMGKFNTIPTDSEYAELREKNPTMFVASHPEGAFTKIKEGLVMNDSLANSIEKSGFQKMLIMGKGDVKTNVEETTSAKSTLFEAIVGAVAVDSGYDMNKISQVVENLISFDEKLFDLGS